MARTDTGLARAQLIGSGLRPNPAIAAQYQTNGRSGAATGEDQGSVSITQDLQLWGARSQRIRAARLEQRRAMFGMRDAERILRQEVTASYRALLFQQQRAALLDSTARLNARIVRAAQSALQQGLGSELDVRLSTSAEKLSELDRDRALREYGIEQLAFARLLGDSLGTSYHLTDSLLPASLAFLALREPEGEPSVTAAAYVPPGRGVDSLVALALATRPDVRAAEYAIEGDNATLALARIAAKPTVAVGGLFTQTRNNRLLGTVPGGSMSRAFGLGLVIGLPVTNRNQGGIARAEVERSAAVLRLSRLRTLVERDVRVAAQRVALSASQVQRLQRDILPTNTAALRLAEVAFGRGQASIFQVLQVQRAYVESSTGLLEAMRQYAAAVTDLEAAIGQPLQ